MKDIREITAKDIMTKDARTIDIEENLNRAISILQSERIHNLVVQKDQKYAGIFGYKELVRLSGRPDKTTKISGFTSKPPLVQEDTSLIDIVEMMYRLNYKIIPVGDEKSINGVITERDILKAICDNGLLSGKKISEFMTPQPLILKEDDTFAKAFTLFREHNVSRIPVIDKHDRLTGILESLDIIKEIASKGEYGRDSGPTKPLDFSAPHGYVPAIISSHQIPVKSLMSQKLVTANLDDNLKEKIRENINLDTSTIIVTDKNHHPIGLIAPKDIIQFLASLKEKETLYLQISGLESVHSIDEFQKSEIHRILDKSVRKISNIAKPSNFTIHAKAYHIEGNKTKYVFRCKFSTSGGLIFAKNTGWDPIDAFSALMGEVERISIKKSKKFTDNIRSKHREIKYNQ